MMSVVLDEKMRNQLTSFMKRKMVFDLEAETASHCIVKMFTTCCGLIEGDVH